MPTLVGLVVIVLGVIGLVLWLTRVQPEGIPGLPGPQVSPEPPPEPITVVAAADIACDPDEDGFEDGEGTENTCRQMHTSDLALDVDPDLVLIPGDTQYEDGEAEEYEESFDPSWGRLKDIIYPVPGNHEYLTDDAEDYFDYFGEAAGDPDEGYYSFERGDWQFLALNTMCEEVGGCEEGDEQYDWLVETLESSDLSCQVAFWHHPRWSNGNYDDNDDVADIYEVLYDHGVEILLSGDSHNYQRFARLDPDKERDSEGVRQFIVGGGGKNLRDVDPGGPLSAFNDEEMGVLVLELLADSYTWEYVVDEDTVTDEGDGDCHGESQRG